MLMIAQVVLVLLVCSTLQAQSCANADAYECQASLCATYNWKNGTCTLVSGSTCSGNVSVPTDTTHTSCTTCSTLGSTDCSQKCIDWYYDTTNSVCKLCTSKYGTNCVACTSTACTSCAYSSQTVLKSDGSACEASTCSSNGLANCIQCYQVGSAYRCLDCASGYSVASDYTCQSTNCTITNCNQCNANNALLCDTCASGYTTNTDKSGCIPVCSDTKCTNCLAPQTCGSCSAGYKTSSGSCVLDCSQNSVANCANCTSPTVCTGCNTGYKSILDGTLCSPDCADTNCYICNNTSNGTCTTCNTGYAVSNGACSRLICSVEYCASCTTVSVCQSCDQYFTLGNNGTSCTPSCISTVPNCAICNGTISCKSCSTGYSLKSSACGKICSNANCDICDSTTTCKVCQAGYQLSTDQVTCRLICTVDNCFTCNPADTCSACNTGFNLASSSFCSAQCADGYANTGTASSPVCALCSSVISNCQTCGQVSGSIKCSACVNTYYLSGQSTCDLCSTSLQNCHACSGPTVCTSCTAGSLINGTCQTSGCNSDVVNCLKCANEATTCTTCVTGFQIVNSACTVSCPATYVFDQTTKVCKCPSSTYQSNSACVPCGGSCTQCTSSSCGKCNDGYYLSNGKCKVCTAHCTSCTSASNCKVCETGYYPKSGNCKATSGDRTAAAGSDGKVYECPSGCKTCSISGANEPICTETKVGFSIVSGLIVKCDASCKTCSGTTNSLCLSCYFGKALSGGTCTDCTDPNALVCLTSNAAYSVLCKTGYSAAFYVSNGVVTGGGTCLACSSFCRKCDNSGPGNCDDGECYKGFVVYSGTANCSACFGGCADCSTSDLTICTACSDGQFLTGSSCTLCDSSCKTCASAATNCTSCAKGLSFINNGCFSIMTGCASLDTTTPTQCSACFAGYVLSNSNTQCAVDTSCNSSSTCTTCIDSFYLSNKQCFPCPTIANCKNCNPNNNTQCLTCNTGFYASDGSCTACNTGCTDCASANFCNVAADGYFLQLLANGENSGITLTCLSPCANCVRDAQNCKSCIAKYAINGTSCLSTARVAMSLTLGGSAGGIALTGTAALFNAFSNIHRLKQSICKNLPSQFDVSTDKKCQNTVIFNYMSAGSIVLGSSLSGGNFSSPEQADSAVGSSFSSDTQLDGVQVLSSNVASQGFTPEDDGGSSTSQQSKTNLGLILGLSIPLVLLLALIVIILAVNRNKQTDDGDNGFTEDVVGETEQEKYHVSDGAKSSDGNYEFI